MTNKEVIMMLTRLKDRINWEDTDCQKKVDALNIAIYKLDRNNTFRRDIPKKVFYEGTGYADGNIVYDEARCPYCDRAFEEDHETWEADYCPDCGQRLDWEWEEDNGETE